MTMVMTVLMVCALVGQQTADAGKMIEILGGETTRAQRDDASAELVKMGKDAIPILIESLEDKRAYDRRVIANRQNLPATASQPKAVIATITVGEHCGKLLYDIITPSSSQYAGNFKVISEQILLVEDWNEWWKANQSKSLSDIHTELQPLVDQYWKQHGITQKVKY